MYTWPLNNSGIRVADPCVTSVSLLHTWIPNHGQKYYLWSTVSEFMDAKSIEKNPYISGYMQFKPVLLESQLYLQAPFFPTNFTCFQKASKDYFPLCHLILLPFYNYTFYQGPKALFLRCFIKQNSWSQSKENSLITKPVSVLTFTINSLWNKTIGYPSIYPNFHQLNSGPKDICIANMCITA